MASFNKAILMGRLTADPEIKSTPGGNLVTSFSLAVDRRYKQGEEKKADFISIVAWRHTAEFITRYFRRGDAILILGEIQTRTYEKDGVKHYVTEVLAQEATFCEAKRNEARDNTPADDNGAMAQKLGSQSYMPSAYTTDGGFMDLPDDDEDYLF